MISKEDLREVLRFIQKDQTPALDPSIRWFRAVCLAVGRREEAPQDALRVRQWTSSGGARPAPKKGNSVKEICVLAKIWRARTFVLLMKPGCPMFKARLVSAQPRSCSLSSVCQGHVLLDDLHLCRMPATPWLKKRPELHKWLNNAQGGIDKQRLASLGNVAVPRMGYFAAQALARQCQV